MQVIQYPEKVDLVNRSRILEDLILKEFPEVINKAQIRRVKSQKILSGIKNGQALNKPNLITHTVYTFSNLDGELTRQFLMYYDSEPYKILNSKTGKAILYNQR